MISILLVEDHASLARTLKLFISKQERLTVVAAVDTAEAALEQIPRLVVDLVIADVSLPAMNGIELVTVLQERFPNLPCLMLSGHHDIFYVQRALTAGARGYITKDFVAFRLVEAVQRVLAGEIYLSDDLRRVPSD